MLDRFHLVLGVYCSESRISVSTPVINSSLSDKEQVILQEWIDWKNQYIRHDSKMRRVSQTFRPEDSEYGTAVMTTPMVIHVFGCIFLLLHLSFSIAILIIGRKKVREVLSYPQRKNWKIHFSVFFIVITIILWMSAIIMAFLSASSGNSGIESFKESSLHGVGDYYKGFSTIDRNIDYVNNQKVLKFPGNSTEPFSVKIQSPEVASIFVRKMDSNANSFFHVAKKYSSIVLGFTFFTAIIGIPLVILLLNGIRRRNLHFPILNSNLFLALLAISFFLAGFWFSKTVVLGDFCEQV